jgi:hypothetical protein
MRVLIVIGIFSVASLAFQTSANAQRGCGSMACHCRVECGGVGKGGAFGVSASIQACTRQCVMRKKAAQH